MKQIFRNNYLEIMFYYKGIAFGVIVDDEYPQFPDVLIILPLFVFKIKTYNFKRVNQL